MVVMPIIAMPAAAMALLRRTVLRRSRVARSASPQARSGASAGERVRLATGDSTRGLPDAPCVEIIDMILDEAAMAAEYRPFALDAQTLEEPARDLEIGGCLVGVEEGRSALGAVGPLDRIVAVHGDTRCPNERLAAAPDIAFAGRDTSRAESKTRMAIFDSCRVEIAIGNRPSGSDACASRSRGLPDRKDHGAESAPRSGRFSATR